MNLPSTPGEIAVSVDTINALIFPPARPSSPASLAAKGAYERGVLTLGALRLASDSSNVTGSGTLLFPGGDIDDISDIDFKLAAHPLDFRDIGVFVPGFDVPGSLRLDARVTGSSDQINFEVDGRSFDGATIHATASPLPIIESMASTKPC